MLYTASISNLQKIKRKIKIYYIIENHNNNAVAPDKRDLDYFKKGLLTWHGFKLNYIAKMYRPEAMEWIKRISMEAVYEDVILVDEEEDANHSCRQIIAELIKNMYTGNYNLKFGGELFE